MWVTSMPQVWDEEGSRKGGGMVTPAPATALLGSLAGWLFRAGDPPAPRVCGTEGGPPVTAPRLRLRDGRHLAYCESGVPKDKARFKVVFSHGFTGSREDSVRASQSKAGLHQTLKRHTPGNDHLHLLRVIWKQWRWLCLIPFGGHAALLETNGSFTAIEAGSHVAF